jgi:hypothetical protein
MSLSLTQPGRTRWLKRGFLAADVGLCGRQVYAGLVEDGREVWDEVRHALHDLEHVSHALNLLLGLCHWGVVLVLYMNGVYQFKY